MNYLNFKKAFTLIALACIQSGVMYAQQKWEIQPVLIQTRWAKDVTPEKVLPEYPRPQMVRNEWQNLNGLWQYAITDSSASKFPSKYDGQILVPYPLESALSGVKKTLLPTQYLWYKRTFTKPNTKGDKRVLLNFGAVDWQTTVYVNGKEVGAHKGGYQNFSLDITDALKSGNNELVVRVYDPSDKGPNPHGKQVLQPQNILYTASSGIWQTVWLETVPFTYISKLHFTPDIDNGVLHLEVATAGKADNYTIEATASNGSQITGQPNSQLSLPVPNAQLWSPDAPNLYNLNVRLLYKGKVVDTVGSYFGMRKIEIKKDEKGVERIFLNNKYTYNLGVLDQGFWPEGLYTAPTDEALQFDIMAIRNMGFNTIRKHIKLEPARWYYYADKMGMLVWQDMVTCANDSPEARQEFEKENKENIAQLYNYPSIVLWVLFNEGWSRYDQKRLTEWMKREDPSRIVDGHTGENYDRGSPENPNEKWASSDLTDIHDYPGPGIPPYLPGKARVLGEWGGVRVPTPTHQWDANGGWGYIQVKGAEFGQKYEFMLKHLKIFEEEGLSGSIYTEPFDVETEENGMMTYDREVIKIPAEKLRQMHSMLLPQAESYAAAPGVFTAQVADTSDPARAYPSLLQQYAQGKKDSVFLYSLALMAYGQNDQQNAQKAADDYILQLKNPFTYRNILFISLFTKKPTDPGFNILLKNLPKADYLLGDKDVVRGQIKNIIFQNDIQPIVSNQNSTPDWDALEKKIITKYGSPGEEMVWVSRAVYNLNKKDFQNFVPIADKIVSKYGDKMTPENLNDFAWAVFQNSSDPKLLKTALAWSKSTLTKLQDQFSMDTYANLLYKLGNKEEAIQWEEHASQAAPDDKIYKDTLDKMKKGEKTWD